MRMHRDISAQRKATGHRSAAAAIWRHQIYLWRLALAKDGGGSGISGGVEAASSMAASAAGNGWRKAIGGVWRHGARIIVKANGAWLSYALCVIENGAEMAAKPNGGR